MGAGIRLAFPWIISELRTFVRHKDGTEGALTIAGCHDNFVIALAIALACLESATTYWPQTVRDGRAEGLPVEAGAREVW